MIPHYLSVKESEKAFKQSSIIALLLQGAITFGAVTIGFMARLLIPNPYLLTNRDSSYVLPDLIDFLYSNNHAVASVLILALFVTRLGNIAAVIWNMMKMMEVGRFRVTANPSKKTALFGRGIVLLLTLILGIGTLFFSHLFPISTGTVWILFGACLCMVLSAIHR